MPDFLKKPIVKRLLLLHLIFLISFIGLIFLNGVLLRTCVGLFGFFSSLYIGYQVLGITLTREKTQSFLQEQNRKIIRKSIELSDVMRQFEDKNYDLEISRQSLNKALSVVREKEKDQRIIFENSPLGIIRLSADGRIIDHNEKFAQLMGSTRESLAGYLTTGNNTPQMQTAIEQAVNGNESIFEGPFQALPERPVLDLRVVFNPVNPGVAPTEVIATIEDISQRVAAELKLKQSHLDLENLVRERTTELISEIEDREAAHEALKKSEEKYRSILENIEDSYFELDLEGNLTFFNNALPDLLGYSEQQLLGMNYKHYTVDEEIPRLMEVFNTVFQTGRTSQLIYCHFLTRNNVRKNIGIISSLMKDKSGEPIGFQGLARDVTQQRMMESRLQHTQKMEAIGNLANGVAHDFNNILGGIIGYTQLAKKHSKGVEKIQPYIDQIIKASERATGLVKQILLFSRNTESEKMPSDMVLVAKEVIKLLRASIPSTIEIRHDFQENISPVLADQTQIHQVFMNLCSNAAYVMKKKGGCLELKLSQVCVEEKKVHGVEELNPGQYVKISVKDTGHGMAQDTIDKIFDPYFTTKEAGEGTGLGLATVHGIIKEHQGIIRVKSRINAGTQFDIYLPVIQEEIEMTGPVVQAEKGSESVLFVDDEEYLAEVGKEMLEDYGYTVQSFTSSKEAFEIFEKNPGDFDLVITDYTMPGMTGAQLAEKIHQLSPDIPIIMCTGISLDQEIIGDIKIDRFLMKPLDMDHLLINVREILDNNRQ